MLATRLMFFLIGIITVYSILPLVKNGLSYPPDPNLTRFPDMLYLMWRHFDSGFYLNIATRGYRGPQTLHRMSNWGFFPLYPVLVVLVGSPFGKSLEVFQVGGLLISNIATLVAATYLYKLTKLEPGEGVATTPSGIWLSFP